MPPRKDKENKEDMDSKFNAILEKLEEFKAENDAKLGQILTQTSDLQTKVSSLRDEVVDLKSSMGFMNGTMEKLEEEMKDKVDIKTLEEVKENLRLQMEDLKNHSQTLFLQLDDLKNRSKRNNIIMWNILEGEEKGIGCINLIQTILVDHMKVPGAEDFIIERAHCDTINTNKEPLKYKDGSLVPRPIFVRFLNSSDKEYLLKRAPRALKNNLYGHHKLSLVVTDDVSKRVRDQRKLLRTRYLADILGRPNVKVAFIPFSVPAQIQYKDGDTWKFFFLPVP